jgi:hypothetical protein
LAEVNRRLERLAVTTVCRLDSKCCDALQLVDVLTGAVTFEHRQAMGLGARVCIGGLGLCGSRIRAGRLLVLSRGWAFGSSGLGGPCWSRIGFGVSCYPGVRSARPPFLWSLSRLWIAQWKRHCSRAACLPRSSNRLAFWTVSIWPKTGSTIALRRA